MKKPPRVDSKGLWLCSWVIEPGGAVRLSERVLEPSMATVVGNPPECFGERGSGLDGRGVLQATPGLRQV